METREDLFERQRPRLASELYDRLTLEQRARELIDGRERIEHDRWATEPEINARTALFEELTAKGHLSRIEFDEPPAMTNERTLRRLINAWSDSLPIWEQERRFSEIVEELTIHEVWQDIKTGLLPPDTLVITISNFPEMAGNREAVQMGYRYLNNKGMARTTGFDNGVRLVEQVSRSRSTDDSAEHFFNAQGFVVGQGSARLLANQIIATKRDFPDGIVDIQRALDNFAGPNIIYGEDRSQADLNVPEYEDLREVSVAREAQAKVFIKKLAEFEIQLNAKYQQGKINYEDKLSSISKRRQELVTEIILLEPGYANDARGHAAAEHFERASMAMAAGDDIAGGRHLETALAVSNPDAGVVCGGSQQTVNQTNLSETASRLYKEAKSERKNWKWKKGLCAVKECPSRPTKTEVGPCSVCRNCQKIFDRKGNPKRVYGARGIFELLFESKA